MNTFIKLTFIALLFAASIAAPAQAFHWDEIECEDANEETWCYEGHDDWYDSF